MKTLLFVLGLGAVLILPPEPGLAQQYAAISVVDPAVSSFVASPNITSSGSAVDFSWQLQNAGGYSFLVPCSAGIKLKYANGTTFPCDTRISSTLAVNDTIRLFVSNISGGTKNFTARIIPKTAAGNDSDTTASDVSVSVSTSPQPITNFSASATTTQSQVPITVYWSSQDIDGVNMQIECKSEIKVFSPSYTASGVLPCGNPIFSPPLGASGSLTLNVNNSSIFALPLNLTLLPAISVSPASYDATHLATLTLTVVSDILPDPYVDSFVASTTVVDSGKPVQVTWVTKNSKGANLKISCAGSLNATSAQSSSASLLCGDQYVFSNDLGASGTLTLFFQNKEKATQTVILTIVPAKKPGEYYATASKILAITVRPEGQSVPATTVSPPAQVVTPTLPVVATSAKAKAVFTQFLLRGSRGPQVTALQEFLKKDSTLYPEGSVTGFFGPATERAIKKFQEKYGLARPGVAGYGWVGPKTRAKLNELQ